MYVYGILI